MRAEPGYRLIEAPEDWEVIPIGELCEVSTGGTPSTSVKEYYENGSIRWMKSADVKGPYVYDVPNRITKLGLANSNAIIHPVGSVMVAMSGRGKTRGMSTILAVESTCSQSVAAIIPDKTKMSSEFLHYDLAYRYEELRNITGSRDRSGLNLRLIRDIKVPVPPINEQAKIGSILVCVDEAIQKTDAIIRKTQRLKKGLMQQLLTKGVRHVKFKQTEIGEIPESWTLVSLKHIIMEPIRNGYSPMSPSKETGKWTLTLSAVSENGFRADKVKPAPLGNPKLDRCKLEVGDILVSRSNTRQLVGLCGVYQGRPSSCYYPDLMMRVRIDPTRADGSFVDHWLRNEFGRKYLASKARGTSGSMVKINREILSELPVPLPQLSEQVQIVAMFRAVDEKTESESRYKERLDGLKRALMHTLLTGKIRVKVN